MHAYFRDKIQQLVLNHQVLQHYTGVEFPHAPRPESTTMPSREELTKVQIFKDE